MGQMDTHAHNNKGRMDQTDTHTVRGPDGHTHYKDQMDTHTLQGPDRTPPGLEGWERWPGPACRNTQWITHTEVHHHWGSRPGCMHAMH